MKIFCISHSSKPWLSEREKRCRSMLSRWWQETWWRWKEGTGSQLTSASSPLMAARFSADTRILLPHTNTNKFEKIILNKAIVVVGQEKVSYHCLATQFVITILHTESDTRMTRYTVVPKDFQKSLYCQNENWLILWVFKVSICRNT